MKKISLFAIALGGILSVKGQQTITGTSPIGYSVNISVATAATASTAPITSTGAGVTWNCSNLQTAMPIGNLYISNPSGQPFANDYPSANRNMNVSLSGTTAINEFYIVHTDSLVKLGGHVSGLPYEIYNNPQLDMKFPFSYGNTVVDTYSKTSYLSNGNVSSTQNGSLTLSYVGYGTLTLPVGTFTNVAMLKKVRTNSIGPTTTAYSWVTYPGGELLMDYDNNGSVKLNYVSSISTSLNEMSDVTNEILLFPSITDKTVYIKKNTGNWKIFVYDITMRNIAYYEEVDHFEMIGPKGIYYVELINKDTGVRIPKKIILQ